MAEDDAEEIDSGEDQQVFLQAAVRAEEDQQSQSRTGERPGHQRARAHAALRIELRESHRNGAVGDHPRQAREQLAQDGLVEDETLQYVLPREMEGELQGTRNDENKEELLSGDLTTTDVTNITVSD